jgi:hypothetical protein
MGRAARRWVVAEARDGLERIERLGSVRRLEEMEAGLGAILAVFAVMAHMGHRLGAWNKAYEEIRRDTVWTRLMLFSTDHPKTRISS